MDVHFLVEGAELINVTGWGDFLELSVGYGDVALLGIEEASGNRVGTPTQHPSENEIDSIGGNKTHTEG